MFIETESTPNPATLKFLPGQDVMGARGTADFPDAEQAARSPLAERLFRLEGVARVFLGADFVTVTKGEDAEWQGLRVPEVLLSGHHAEVARWRRAQSEAVTRERRPDLLSTEQRRDPAPRAPLHPAATPA